MPTDPLAQIDLAAIRHNLRVAASLAPGSRQMAVIKADAYGHGMARVAGALEDADALAVARTSEAVALREQGVRQPLVVLEGFADAEELELACRYRLRPVLHGSHQVSLLQQRRLPGPLSLWLKVDTGMNRLGFSDSELAAVLQALRTLADVEPEPGVMTHLACADDPGSRETARQLLRFAKLRDSCQGDGSIANSAGIIGWPDSHSQWNRPGLMLYGVNPFGCEAVSLGLRPAMTFIARLIAIRRLAAGATVGYGGIWRCPEAMRLGVVGVGYGDGYPREIRPGTPVLIDDQEVPIVGRVSMDMLAVDLRSVPEAAIGDPVILWGKGLPIERIAGAANTVSYTLMCGVAARVTRVVS